MDKYPLSESNRNIFLVELNKAIEDAAEDDSKNILQQDFDSLAVYPPNGGFTDEEKVALRSIAVNLRRAGLTYQMYNWR
jgi:hypothetical protein